MSGPKLPVKLVAFDLDDTLIHARVDESVGATPTKFTPHRRDPDGAVRSVVDGPHRVQVLVPHAREVLAHLQDLGLTLALASMGPEWQMRRFLEAFEIAHFFDWEIGAYDRRDKGEKVELVIEHYNGREIARRPVGDPAASAALVHRHEVVFVDDNLGYLARVDQYLPGVRVVWAHYAGERGLLDLYEDLREQHDIDLAPRAPDTGGSQNMESSDPTGRDDA